MEEGDKVGRIRRRSKLKQDNDPLGQSHSLASSEHCFHLKFLLKKWARTDIRTTCVKTIITTGRDCGSAEWIIERSRNCR